VRGAEGEQERLVDGLVAVHDPAEENAPRRRLDDPLASAGPEHAAGDREALGAGEADDADRPDAGGGGDGGDGVS
jgi:hypothetical protein